MASGPLWGSEGQVPGRILLEVQDGEDEESAVGVGRFGLLVQV